jgi:hypothetical protein
VWPRVQQGIHCIQKASKKVNSFDFRRTFESELRFDSPAGPRIDSAEGTPEPPPSARERRRERRHDPASPRTLDARRSGRWCATERTAPRGGPAPEHLPAVRRPSREDAGNASAVHPIRHLHSPLLAAQINMHECVMACVGTEVRSLPFPFPRGVVAALVSSGGADTEKVIAGPTAAR